MTEGHEDSPKTLPSANDPLGKREALLLSRIRMPDGETGPEGQALDFRLIHDFLTDKLPRMAASKITGEEEHPIVSEVVIKILNDSTLRLALDDFLIERAQLLGPHILLGWLARDRIFAWLYGYDSKADGRDLWKRFSEALDLFAAVQRGEKKHPVENKNLYGSRQDLVKEMKHLLPVVKKSFAGRLGHVPSAASYSEVAERMLATVEHNIIYRRLDRNFWSLAAFLCALRQGEDKEMLRMRIRNFTIRPADLINEWLGSAENRNPEDLRQLISNLGREKKLKTSN